MDLIWFQSPCDMLWSARRRFGQREPSIALAIDYIADTGYEPTAEDQLKYWPIWQAIVRNAVAYLQANQSLSGVRK